MSKQQQYKPIEIANTFLAEFGKKCGGISHMKLQKLVYCTHGWWLVYNHDSSLLIEKPEVWKFGPVFSSMYHELKVYGMRPITEPIATNPFSETDTFSVTTNSDRKAYKLIDWIWKRYGHLSAIALSEMTHEKGTAWRTVAELNNFRVPVGLVLEDSYIREEFENIKKKFEASTR